MKITGTRVFRLKLLGLPQEKQLRILPVLQILELLKCTVTYAARRHL